MSNIEKLLECFEPTIKKLAKTWEIYPLEWEDIAQELRIHLLEKYNDKVKKFDSWAYITCRNKIKDLHKFYTRNNRGKNFNIDDFIDKI